MAKVTHVPAVEEIQTVVVEPEKFLLELSPQEAAVMRVITGQILTPYKSELRDLVEGIWTGLMSAGAPTNNELTFEGSIKSYNRR